MRNLFLPLSIIAWSQGAWGIAAKDPSAAFAKKDRADAETTLEIKSESQRTEATYTHQGCAHTYIGPRDLSSQDFAPPGINSSYYFNLDAIDKPGPGLCIGMAEFKKATPCTDCEILSNWNTGEVTCSFPHDDAREYSGGAELKYQLPYDDLRKIHSHVRLAMKATDKAKSAWESAEGEAHRHRAEGVSLYRRAGAALKVAQLHMRLRAAESHEASEDENRRIDTTWWDKKASPRICQIIRTKFWPRMLKYVTARLGPMIAAGVEEWTIERAKVNAEKLRILTEKIDALLAIALVPRNPSSIPAEISMLRLNEWCHPSGQVEWWFLDSWPDCRMYFPEAHSESKLIGRLTTSCLNPAVDPSHGRDNHLSSRANEEYRGSMIVWCYTLMNRKRLWKYSFPIDDTTRGRSFEKFNGICAAITVIQEAFALEAKGWREGLHYAR